ncbi:MAG: SDR family NAD(P)-dependent oxidoreductase [Armatimonadota bacterium]
MQDRIAITGMAGRFPGARTLDQYWANLRDGADCLTTLTDADLRAAGVEESLSSNPRYVRTAALVDEIDRFDAGLFGFSQREAERLDPQHRVLMECAWEALEDAGCDPGRFDGSIGVFAGASISGYLLFNLHAGLDPHGSAASLLTMLGNDKDYLATHLGYKLGLTGPCVSVQTACSTSLVAVHLAAQSLLNGECDVALAGGVTLRVPSRVGYLWQDGSILSRDGRCRSFDARASGTVFGSGAGVVVLRRLEDAARDRDRVRAVILGSAINNDGARKVGFTAPSLDGQAAVIAEAIAVADISPESISYVEAHGTGTPLGDPIEVAALNEVFRGVRSPVALGSVKSSVGHLEAAAGVAGLIKTVLAMEQGVLPPSLHFETPNPEIDFEAGPFRVNTSARPWTGLRRAGVSSFGIGGTNAHVVLEQAPAASPESQSGAPERPLHLFCFSARSETALRQLARRCADHFQEAVSLADAAYTVHTGRAPLACRAFVVAADAGQARERLLAVGRGEAAAEPQTAATAIDLPPEEWSEAVRRGQTTWEALLHGWGRRWVQGETLDWGAYDREHARRKVTLPTYPFERERYWIDPPRKAAPAPASGHPLLGTRVRTAAGPRVFEAVVGGDAPSYLSQHRVHGAVVFPAAGYLEMALAIGSAAVRDVTFREALLLPDGDERAVQTVVEPDGAFRIFSEQGEAWVEHASGRLESAATATATVDLPSAEERCAVSVPAEEYYAHLDGAGIGYGPVFRAIRSLRCGPGEALAELELPEEARAGAGAYRLHPVLLDACFQTLGAALGAGEPAESFMPFALERLNFNPEAGPPCRAHAAARALPDGETAAGDLVLLDAAGRAVVTVTNLQCKRARPESLHRDASIERDLYELVWRPAPNAGAPVFEDPAHVGAALAGELDRLSGDPELQDYRELTAALDELAPHYAAAALYELGVRFEPGEPLRLPVAARPYDRLLERLCEMLSETGVVAGSAPDWRVVRTPAPGDLPSRVRELMAAYPVRAAEIALFARCGESLSRVLIGEVDPVSLLFSGEPGAEVIYRETPFARALHALLGGALEAMVGDLPNAPRLRVLEVGAGTGATAAVALPLLSGRLEEYCFTDLSPHFLHAAEEAFSAYPELRTGVLDLNLDPQAQGYSTGGYHLILATNVLHATGDLRRTLARLRTLLAPGGMLAVIEGAGKVRWIDLVFGLTKGWWSFEDTDLRSHPLVPCERWVSLLEEAGFRSVTGVAPDRGEAQQMLFLARAPEAAGSGRWVVSARPESRTDALLARLPDSVEALSEVDPDDPLPDGEWDGVLHLAALDERRGADGAGEQLGGGARAVESLLHAIRHAASRQNAPRLLIVTCGAQRVRATDVPALSQSALWGIAPVLQLELPELRCRIVDLDPCATPEQNARALQAELRDTGSEARTAWRDGCRHAARLQALPRADAVEVPAEPFRLRKSPGGSLRGLTFQPEERRAPGPGEIEIRVAATGLNFKDVLNALDLVPGEAPLGGECAGTVERVGPGVTQLRPGDPVMAAAGGSFASCVTLPAALAVPKPAFLSAEQAASIPIASVTAWYSLAHLARLAPGERVLISAASGGVGLAAIQIARSRGAEVFALAGSPEKRAYLRSLEVPHVFHSRTPGFARRILDATGGEGVDVVLSSLPGELVPEALDALKRGGRFIELGRVGAWTAEQVRAVRPDVERFEVRLDEASPELFGSLLREVAAALESGELSPPPVRCYPLPEVPAPFRRMQEPDHVGKVVVSQRTGVCPESTYLITGGMGGLGLEVARHLVRLGARHLALAGRSLPGEAARSVMAELTAAGARVECLQADVSDRAQVEALLRKIRSEMPPLRGVFHAAGVLADALLPQQSVERFDAVWGPKAAGAWHLHELMGDVDLFVLFSSAAGLLGSRGQANHAAASAFLDSLAEYRRSQGLRAVCIDWGAWSQVGAAAALESALREQGMGTISPERGVRALELLLRRDRTRAAVLPLDLPRLAQAHAGGGLPSLLSELLSGPETAESQPDELPTRSSAPAPPAGFRVRLEATPADRRLELLFEAVAEVAAQMLRLPSGETLDPARPLNELGLDSLLALDMRDRLGEMVGAPLPATILFSYPTVEALARHLAADWLGIAVPQDAGPQPHEPAAEAAPVHNLSEDELDSLLEQFARRIQEQ